MGNRSKAEWMSCFARSPSLNGFQGWMRLCMCCLAGCVRACVCMCVICMCMQIYVCAWVPLCLQVCLCDCFYQSVKCTLEFLLCMLCTYRTTIAAVKPAVLCILSSGCRHVHTHTLFCSQHSCLIPHSLWSKLFYSLTRINKTLATDTLHTLQNTHYLATRAGKCKKKKKNNICIDKLKTY